jgi:hypothetical protein
MLKSGIVAQRKLDLNTKVIYESEPAEIMAEKIITAFDIGDKVRVYGVEKIKHTCNVLLQWELPEDIACEIVGVKNGFVVCYPKGHIVIIHLAAYSDGYKEFKWAIGIDENKKHYYDIWRSK